MGCGFVMMLLLGLKGKERKRESGRRTRLDSFARSESRSSSSGLRGLSVFCRWRKIERNRFRFAHRTEEERRRKGRALERRSVNVGLEDHRS